MLKFLWSVDINTFWVDPVFLLVNPRHLEVEIDTIGSKIRATCQHHSTWKLPAGSPSVVNRHLVTKPWRMYQGGPKDLRKEDPPINQASGKQPCKYKYHENNNEFLKCLTAVGLFCPVSGCDFCWWVALEVAHNLVSHLQFPLWGPSIQGFHSLNGSLTRFFLLNLCYASNCSKKPSCVVA